MTPDSPRWPPIWHVVQDGRRQPPNCIQEAPNRHKAASSVYGPLQRDPREANILQSLKCVNVVLLSRLVACSVPRELQDSSSIAQPREHNEGPRRAPRRPQKRPRVLQERRERRKSSSVCPQERPSAAQERQSEPQDSSQGVLESSWGPF